MEALAAPLALTADTVNLLSASSYRATDPTVRHNTLGSLTDPTTDVLIGATSYDGPAGQGDGWASEVSGNG